MGNRIGCAATVVAVYRDFGAQRPLCRTSMDAAKGELSESQGVLDMPLSLVSSPLKSVLFQTAG